MSNVRVNYKSGVTAGRGMEIVSSRRSNRHQLGPYAVAETRTPSVPVSARPNVASIDSLPWSVGIPLFEYPNLVSRSYATTLTVPRVPKWEATARRPRRLRSLRKRSELSFLL
jgi:hypothetical protein